MASGIAGCLREGSSVISQHGLWLHQGRLARKIGNERRVPVIIHPHGMLEPWALRRSPWKKRLVGRLWEYENLKEAACLRVTARAELESVRGFGLKNAVALIPNGIDVDDFAKLPDVAEAGERFPALAGRRVLLFLSRVHPKKGLPLLLEVWKKLGALRADWVLAIAGPDEGGHTAKLQGLVLEWGLEDSVKFLGPLFGEDKLAAYSLAQLFVLPSYSENFGVAVAEALAGAVPVITTCGTPWEGLKEHGCGWWVEANGAALGEAVREALSLPERELALMGEKGRRWMSLDFNWERIAAQMVRVCEWTLGGGQPPGCVITN
jgi:glycosyltransferase involved in cell wall biosynthesis